MLALHSSRRCCCGSPPLAGKLSPRAPLAVAAPTQTPTHPPTHTPPQECRQLGIDSRDIRGGLLGLTAELPALAGAAVDALQADGITQGIAYYAALVGSQQQGGEAGAAAAAAADAVLPTLREVRDGRTVPPAEPAEPAVVDASAAASGSGALEVDWDLGAALEAVGGGEDGGSGGGGGAPAGGISWDLDASDLAAAEAAPGAAPGVISWDVDVEVSAEGAEGEGGSSEAGASSAPAGISWDIELSGVGEDTTASEQPDSGAAAAGSGDTVAGPATAAAEAAAAAEATEPAAVRRLVADAAYRAQLLDDLHELRAFLMQVRFGAQTQHLVLRWGWAATASSAVLGRAMRQFQQAVMATTASAACILATPAAKPPSQPHRTQNPQRCRELGGSGRELLTASAPEAVRHVSADLAAAMLEAVNAALAQFGGAFCSLHFCGDDDS